MADSAQSTAMKPVSQLRSAEDLSRKMDSLRKARQRKERDWKLNLSFYRGNHYAYWNPSAKRIEQLPTEDGEKPRYRVRIVSNQIAIGVQSLISKLNKTKPMWGATPSEPGDKAVKTAEFAQDLLEDWWHRLDMGAHYEDALRWAIIAGKGYLKYGWDPFAATEMRFLLNPHTGEPIVNQAEQAEFRAAIEQQGLDPRMFETVAYMGDVKIESMSPFDVFLDPAAKTIEDAKWVICAHHLEPDEIKTRWGKDGVVPDKVSASPDEAVPATGSEKGTDPTLKTVYIGYFKKTPQLPNGRYVVFMEDPDEILFDEDWPEGFPNEVPLAEFSSIPVPGGTDSDSPVTHARPLNKQLNRLLSQITEYTNMVIKPRVWAPVNSMKTRLTTEPGAVYEYTPVGNFKPEIEELPSIPPYVFEFLKDLGSRLYEMFGMTEVTEGGLPPNLEAADAIDLLQEMATDRFAPTILANERQLARAGQFMLALAQKYYTEPRLMIVRGLGGMASVREFTNAQFSGQVTVHVEAGSSMPKTRAARRKQIEQWIGLGLIRPERAWKYYDIADIKDIAVQFAQDEDQALRENDKIIKGIPLNPEAMQQAMVMVNQGLNPETGDTIETEEEMQMVLLRASLQPGPADNDDVHAEKHAAIIKSPEFDSHSPEVRQRFLIHFEMTMNRIGQRVAQPEAAAPKVSLQLKGAVTPTAEAAILRSSGVQVDPETLVNEPAMETWVSDSVDKPDADAMTAGQEANHLSQAAQAMLATDIAHAEAQQSFAHRERQHGRDEELHSERMRTEQAKADDAEKKARESSYKPQPKATSKAK